MGKTTTSKGSTSKGSRFAGFLWPGHLDECCLGNEDDAPNLPVWKLTSLKSLVHSVGPKSQVGPDLIRPQKFRQLLEGCLSGNRSIGVFHFSPRKIWKWGKSRWHNSRGVLERLRESRTGACFTHVLCGRLLQIPDLSPKEKSSLGIICKKRSDRNVHPHFRSIE